VVGPGLLTVDGLGLAALRRNRHGRRWLAIGIAVSVAAKMLARYPDLAATSVLTSPRGRPWPRLPRARQIDGSGSSFAGCATDTSSLAVAGGPRVFS
jgi:hypothetical protein